MIRSMTGFGKAATRTKQCTVIIEMKTINHKFFELSARMPNGLGQVEDKLKSAVSKKIKRGKVYLNIELEGQKDAPPGALINEGAAKRYKNELVKLKKNLGLEGGVSLNQIITLPGVVVSEAGKTNARKYFPAVKEALDRALNKLVADRGKEGRALCKDLTKRAKNIRSAVEHIDERVAISIVKYKNHMTNKIKELTGAKNVERGRLEQEVALFAKNCDVSEELVRLRSHLASFKDSLMANGEAGKKLDFIAQELHREANTIASKSSDFKISNSVIQMKSDIEKIREQVKNIE